jgi:succinyl-CoA synthetase beta subunit
VSLLQIRNDLHGKRFDGEPFESILLEEVRDIERELYLSISVDAAAGIP